jgi:hypothetical protein
MRKQAEVKRGRKVAVDLSPEYFLGDSKIFGPDRKLYVTNTILVEKVYQPKNDLFLETAMQIAADGQIIRSTVTIKVNGNRITLSDDCGVFTGEGEIFGPPWSWTYWKAVGHFPDGKWIELEDFTSDPAVLGARKHLYAPDNSLLCIHETWLRSISAATFHNLFNVLAPRALTVDQLMPPAVADGR